MNDATAGSEFHGAVQELNRLVGRVDEGTESRKSDSPRRRGPIGPHGSSRGPARTRMWLTGLIVVAVWGCDAQAFGTGSALDAASGGAEVERTPVHVDSIFPMEEEIRRFREGIPEVKELSGGTSSREALVDGLIDALERADTTALTALPMTRAEFAWLYFPNTMYIAPPYELPPGLVWFQQQNRSSTGLTRLLRRYAGQTLHYDGFSCPDEGGEAFGEGRIWHGCTVLGTLPTGESVEERLFGSILEWGGRYKLVSYSNEL